MHILAVRSISSHPGCREPPLSLSPDSGVRREGPEQAMKTKSETTATDARDIQLMVKLTLERGSMTKEQVLNAGISEASFIRNSPAVAASVRAANMEFAA
jgi:hypothetical protein